MCVIGKGITFDSVGLNVKPDHYMMHMHRDKTGAFSAMGVALWCMLHSDKLETGVVLFMPFTENSIGPKSYKPGHTITYGDTGVKLEIRNTDAEGRVVMADCLVLASRMESIKEIITIATLTGSAASFGPFIPVMYNDPAYLKMMNIKSKFLVGRLEDGATGDAVELLTPSSVYRNANTRKDVIMNSSNVPFQTQAAYGFLEEINSVYVTINNILYTWETNPYFESN